MLEIFEDGRLHRHKCLLIAQGHNRCQCQGNLRLGAHMQVLRSLSFRTVRDSRVQDERCTRDQRLTRSKTRASDRSISIPIARYPRTTCQLTLPGRKGGAKSVTCSLFRDCGGLCNQIDRTERCFGHVLVIQFEEHGALENALHLRLSFTLSEGAKEQRECLCTDGKSG